MLVEGKVGPVAATDQTINELRQSKDCALVALDGHARFQEAVYRGSVFSASNQAGQATVAALTTNITGYVLYNPINSGKDLVLWDVETTPTVAIATAVVGNIYIAAGVGPNVAAPTSTTALTVYNNLINPANTNVARVFSTATFAVAPVAFRNIATYQRDSAAASNVVQVISVPIDGAIIIPPGAFVSIASLTALTLQTSMTWEEIPI